jgi:hypothetical protein
VDVQQAVGALAGRVDQVGADADRVADVDAPPEAAVEVMVGYASA